MAHGRRMGAAALAVSGILWAGSSLAEDVECRSFGAMLRDIGQPGGVSLARVASVSPRVNFIKRGSTQAGCPSTAPGCRDKTYLVPGDEVVVSGRKGEFACAAYVNAKGHASDGWLPQAVLTSVQDQPQIRRRDWLGTWRSGPEREIAIAAVGASNKLTIKGDATWGASDPERVRRGAVNLGQLDAELSADGAELSFGMGEVGTLAYADADNADCKVRMRRLGPYMIVRDNDRCGGANVSFTGVYRR